MHHIQKIPIIKCYKCLKEFQQWSGVKGKSHYRRKFCSNKCRYLSTKKDITGYKSCLFCDKKFPYRDSLKVRSYNGIASIKSKFCSRVCVMRFIAKDELIIIKRKYSLKGKSGNKNKRSSETRLKISLANRKEKHWNWKGGISPKNNSERSCIELKDWRRKVFHRDNYTCVLCGYSGKGLEADHIKSWSEYPKLRFTLNNGRTLCKKCHSETPNYRGRVNKKIGRPPKVVVK